MGCQLHTGVTECEFKERVKIINRNSRRGAACGNIIVEVTKRMKEIIHEEGRLFVTGMHSE